MLVVHLPHRAGFSSSMPEFQPNDHHRAACATYLDAGLLNPATEWAHQSGAHRQSEHGTFVGRTHHETVVRPSKARGHPDVGRTPNTVVVQAVGSGKVA